MVVVLYLSFNFDVVMRGGKNSIHLFCHLDQKSWVTLLRNADNGNVCVCVQWSTVPCSERMAHMREIHGILNFSSKVSCRNARGVAHLPIYVVSVLHVT